MDFILSDIFRPTILEKIEVENSISQYWTSIPLIPMIQLPIKTKDKTCIADKKVNKIIFEL